MFTKKLEQMFEERSNNMNEYIKETQERLLKIEEKIKPPTFKKGDFVNFLLVGQEFEGEIVEPNYKYELNDYGSDYGIFPIRTKIIESWNIAYLDNNNVIQVISVQKDDIWVEEEDDVDYLNERINGIALRLNKLEGRGTKK